MNNSTFGMDINMGQRTNDGNLDWSQGGLNKPFNILDGFRGHSATYGLPSDLGYPASISDKFYIYSNPTVSSAYVGGVLHPNGMIYFIPYSETEVLEIDPNVANGVYFGSAGASSTKWRHGFLGRDGKIYCIPSTSSVIGIIDPITKTIDTTSWVHNLSYSHEGGCYGADGKYYLTPTDSTSAIGEIDVINRTTKEYPLGGSHYHSGAVAAPNGKIYFIPRDDENMLVFDVFKKTWEYVVTVGNGYANFGYTGGVLAPNGCIYCAPSSGDKVMEFCTATNKSRLIGSYTNASTLAFCQAIYAPDGYIYMIPLSSPTILQVDWRNGTTKEIDCYVGSQKWQAGCFDKNGKFWSATYSSDSILCIDFQQAINERAALCQYGS